jgi:hypothetical protein
MMETAMTHMVIVARTLNNKPKIVTYSWTTGVVAAKIPNRIKTDDDAIAFAMYLNRHGQHDEAEMFLDRYCA